MLIGCQRRPWSGMLRGERRLTSQPSMGDLDGETISHRSAHPYTLASPPDVRIEVTLASRSALSEGPLCAAHLLPYVDHY
jgi:hypothetical protein